MNIIADQNIPYVRNFFAELGHLTLLPHEKITADTVKNADALLVRSVTQVNTALVEHSSLRFIGSATAGIDHLDTHYLDSNKIIWAYAPGCNARAVADYVLLSIAQLLNHGYLKKTPINAGVIGVGHVGTQIHHRLNALGFNVILNDPPRAECEPDFISTPLDQWTDLDLICMHTPYITDGQYPTAHLIDENFLSSLNPNCVLINAGRGGCVDTHALKETQLTTVLDVWEQEPNIDVALAASAFIATPHIAGYSQAAKYRATQQLFVAFSQHFEIDHIVLPLEDTGEYQQINFDSNQWIHKAIKIEDLKKLSDAWTTALKNNSEQSAVIFKAYRNDYPLRVELVTR